MEYKHTTTITKETALTTPMIGYEKLHASLCQVIVKKMSYEHLRSVFRLKIHSPISLESREVEDFLKSKTEILLEERVELTASIEVVPKENLAASDFLEVYNHEKNSINLSHLQEPVVAASPTELHYKDNGSTTNRPSLLIVMKDDAGRSVYGQMSIETLRTALSQLGYSLNVEF